MNMTNESLNGNNDSQQTASLEQQYNTITSMET